MHKYRHNAAYKSVLSYWVQILYKETYSHTHSCLHSQGHTDSAICSDKLQSETLVGLLFTFAHLKAPSIREGLSSHAGKVTHKGSEC